MLFNPITLIIALGITLFTIFFVPGGRLSEIGFFPRLIVNVFNLTLYYSFSYFALGHYLAFGLRRYWPWLYVQLTFYIPLVMITGFVDSYLHIGGFDLADILWSMVTSLAIVVIAVVLTVLYFKQALERLLIEIDRPGCLFKSQKPPEETLISLLSQGKRGDLQKISGANQYIEVQTEKGVEMLRLSMKDAEGLIPSGLGMRVHRSVWIAFDHVESWIHKGGKVLITPKTGDPIPVGGTYADAFLETITAYHK